MRREFSLPQFDVDYLNTLGLQWETLGGAGGTHWLLIHEWPIKAGYNVDRATVALRLPSNYPDGQIDMAYFSPHLARKDGRTIGASSSAQQVDGQSFQRWSRHRTRQAPWRPGEDDVSTHLVLVDDWLERELEKR